MSEIPEYAKQWRILLQESDGTKDVLPSMRYLFKGMERIKFLHLKSGADLGWTKDAAAATAARVMRWRFVHLGPPDRPVQHGEQIAIGWDDMFLRVGKPRKKGVTLHWADQPAFEWRLEGGPPGTPVRRNADVALHNDAAGEPLVAFERHVGDIGWPSEFTFPENDVAVLRDYRHGLPAREAFADALESLRRRVRRDVQPARARHIDEARALLARKLRDPAFTSALARLENEDGTGIYDRITAGADLGLAVTGLDDFTKMGEPFAGESTVDVALTAEPVTYTYVIEVNDGHYPRLRGPDERHRTEKGRSPRLRGRGKGVGKREELVTGEVPGYSGPSISSAHREALGAYIGLFGGPEREFRLGVLRAECHLGTGDIDGALGEYQSLIAGKRITRTHRKFVALRAAAAQVAAGERAFRASRRLDESQREQVRDRFGEARKLLASHGIAPVNPRRQELELIIARHEAQLDSHLNVLGLRESFVPVQKLDFLEHAAAEATELAEETAAAFEAYLAKANQKEDVTAELTHEADVAQRDIEKARERQGIADDQFQRAKKLRTGIEEQQAALGWQAVLDGTQSFFSSVASIGIGKGSGASGLHGVAAIAGIGSTLVRYNSQQDQLAVQHAIASIDIGIAERQQSIAAIDVQLADERARYLAERLAVTKGRDLGSDLYYRLARECRELTEECVRRGMLTAFLYERAVAYFLGKPAIDHVEFDYLDKPASSQTERVLNAVRDLKGAVRGIQGEFVKPDLPKFDDYVDTFSLAQTFPLEFARLRQEGETSFALSLYDLEKRRPGSWGARLIRADVAVRGLVPVTMTGELTHMGRFLIRDQKTTLEPDVTRLLPAAADVTAALASQQRGETDTASVGGVLAFDFDNADTINLDADPPAPITPITQKFAKQLIEDYGPAGLWRLSLRGFDLANLTDVELRLNLRSFETDILDLRPRIEELLDEYEREQELAVGDTLDRVAFVSLRTVFPDAVAALGSGPVVFRLADRHFPQIPDPRVKAVVVLALDANEDGIPGLELHIAKPDASFELTRTTGQNGFSEDLTVPLVYREPGDRFEATGEWSLALADPAQAADLEDVQLFFVCEFAR